MAPRLDALLRSRVVTPDMHRVPRSVADDEANSNFAFTLPGWDRLLGTYRDQPREGHGRMLIGISTFREARQCNDLWRMLGLPFVGRITDYAINRRDRAESD